MKRQRADRTGGLGYVLLEPVPVRLTEAYSVLEAAKHPNAALLWIEFQASPEGQKILDQYGPYEASYHSAGSEQLKVTTGKKLSVVDWDHYSMISQNLKKLTEAYGFPRAEGK